jgi:hypothetical protein
MDDVVVLKSIKPFLETLGIDGISERWDAFLASQSAAPTPTAPATPAVAAAATVRSSGKKTGYQIFFSERSAVLRKNQPGITFREISQAISKEWEVVSKEEKEGYKNTADLQQQDTNTGKEQESLHDKSMAELHKICEAHQLTKRGNKTVVVQRILESTRAQPVPTTVSTTAVNNQEGEALQVLRLLREKNVSVQPFARRRRDAATPSSSTLAPPVIIKNILFNTKAVKPPDVRVSEEDLVENEEEITGLEGEEEEENDEENEEEDDSNTVLLPVEEDEDEGEPVGLEEEEENIFDEDDAGVEGPDLMGPSLMSSLDDG